MAMEAKRSRPWADAEHPGNKLRPKVRCIGCGVKGCVTHWGPWCFDCNVKRMDRLDAAFDLIRSQPLTVWLTHEESPRRLRVVGRSAIDPDCLVAYVEGSDESVWIVDDGSRTKNCFVTGLSVRASIAKSESR